MATAPNDSGGGPPTGQAGVSPAGTGRPRQVPSGPTPEGVSPPGRLGVEVALDDVAAERRQDLGLGRRPTPSATVRPPRLWAIRGQALSRGPQDLVPDGVPIVVVDQLEVVDVAEHDPDMAIVTLEVGDGGLEALAEGDRFGRPVRSSYSTWPLGLRTRIVRRAAARPRTASQTTRNTGYDGPPGMARRAARRR